MISLKGSLTQVLRLVQLGELCLPGHQGHVLEAEYMGSAESVPPVRAPELSLPAQLILGNGNSALSTFLSIIALAAKTQADASQLPDTGTLDYAEIEPRVKKTRLLCFRHSVR